MASGLYDKFKNQLMNKLINMDTDDIRVALVGSYTPNYTTHDFFDDVTNVIGTPQALDNTSVTTKVFDADDEVFAAVAGGSTINNIVIYKFVTVAGDSPLIACIDGFSVATNGGNITIQWDAGASKIFAL